MNYLKNKINSKIQEVNIIMKGAITDLKIVLISIETFLL